MTLNQQSAKKIMSSPQSRMTEILQIHADGTTQQSTKMLNKCKPRAVICIQQ